jgi:hypothetical protein
LPAEQFGRGDNSHRSISAAKRECNRAEPRVADDLQPGRDDLQPVRKEINNCSTSSFTK